METVCCFAFTLKLFLEATSMLSGPVGGNGLCGLVLIWGKNIRFQSFSPLVQSGAEVDLYINVSIRTSQRLDVVFFVLIAHKHRKASCFSKGEMCKWSSLPLLCRAQWDISTLYTSLFWLLLIWINSAVKWQDLIYSNKRSMQQKGDSHQIIVLSKTSYFKDNYVLSLPKFKTITFLLDCAPRYSSVSWQP